MLGSKQPQFITDVQVTANPTGSCSIDVSGLRGLTATGQAQTWPLQYWCQPYGRTHDVAVHMTVVLEPYNTAEVFFTKSMIYKTKLFVGTGPGASNVNAEGTPSGGYVQAASQENLSTDELGVNQRAFFVSYEGDALDSPFVTVGKPELIWDTDTFCKPALSGPLMTAANGTVLQRGETAQVLVTYNCAEAPGPLGLTTLTMAISVSDSLGVYTPPVWRWIKANVPLPPDSPKDVEGDAGNHDIDVTFTVPRDHGSSITSYIVNYTDSNTNVKSQATFVRQFPDKAGDSVTLRLSNLQNGDLYSLKVIAVNGVGASAPGTMQEPVSPGAPVALIVILLLLGLALTAGAYVYLRRRFGAPAGGAEAAATAYQRVSESPRPKPQAAPGNLQRPMAYEPALAARDDVESRLAALSGGR